MSRQYSFASPLELLAPIYFMVCSIVLLAISDKHSQECNFSYDWSTIADIVMLLPCNKIYSYIHGIKRYNSSDKYFSKVVLLKLNEVICIVHLESCSSLGFHHRMPVLPNLMLPSFQKIDSHTYSVQCSNHLSC